MARERGALIVWLTWIVGAGCSGDAATTASPVNFFVASAGGRVVRSSRLGMPERLIDGSHGETTGTAFGEDGRAGDTVTAEIETARVVGATSFRLRAAHDGGNDLHRRSMNGFRLEADADGDGGYETMVLDRMIAINYAAVPGNAVTTGSGELDLTFRFPAVRSRRWRFSATQGFETPTPHDGPRIRELELYAVP